MAAEDFMEIPVQNQKLFEGIQFPSILSPALNSPLTLPSFTQSIKIQKPFLDSLLHKSGAVLFRGFPVNTPSDFNNEVESFGFDELYPTSVAFLPPMNPHLTRRFPFTTKWSGARE